MPTNTDRNGENSLAAAVELTAELTENTCFKICRESIHFILTKYKFIQKSMSMYFRQIKMLTVCLDCSADSPAGLCNFNLY